MKSMKIKKILQLMIFEALPLSEDQFGAPERCASAQCSNNLQRRSCPLLVIRLQVGRPTAVVPTKEEFSVQFLSFSKNPI